MKENILTYALLWPGRPSQLSHNWLCTPDPRRNLPQRTDFGLGQMKYASYTRYTS